MAGPTDGAQPGDAVDRPVRVLVFTTLFPNPSQPQFGIFVRHRVAAVAAHCPTHVVAPILTRPGYDRGAGVAVPGHEHQGLFDVSHPRFTTIPGAARAADGWLLFVQSLPYVRRLRTKFPFDLIDAHYAFPDGAAAVLLGAHFRVPVCLTVRGGDIDLLPRFRMRRRIIRQTLQRADRVFSVSLHLANAIARLGVPLHRVRIVPNGIDTAVFHLQDRRLARRSVGFPEDRTLILCAADLLPDKGVHVLIEALPLLPTNGAAPPQLVIVGTADRGRYQARIEKRIRELGLGECVRIVGSKPQHELSAWYNAADLMVLPTFREGCPNVVREAIACGLPVVASRVGGVPELITSEKLGVLVEPGDSPGLARAIGAALSQPWDRETIAGIGVRPTWETVGRTVAAEFDTLRREPLVITEARHVKPRLLGRLVGSRLYSAESVAVLLSEWRAEGRPVLSNALHLKEAARWILRAQAATPDDGVSGGYSLEDGWIPSYSETTGYIIPTLLAYATYSGAAEYRERALAMAEWELTVQCPDGGFPGHFVDQVHPPVVFNTGQVLFGLLAACQATDDARFLTAAQRAGGWLAKVQEEDGAWRRYNYRGHVNTYNARTAWALVEFALATHDERLLAVGIRHLDWVTKQAEPNGWLNCCAFEATEDPFLHTIAYAVQGLLEAGLRLRRSDYVELAERTARAMLKQVDARGFIPGRFNREWHATARYSCLTGNAQMSVIWARLYGITGDPKFREAALCTNRFLKSGHDCSTSNPNVRGAIKGSHPIWGRYLFATYPNWAAKFFMDAILMEEATAVGNSAGIRCW